MHPYVPFPSTSFPIAALRLLTDRPPSADLISPEVSRTEKFLNALSVGAVILNEKWISASIKAGKLLGTSSSHLMLTSLDIVR